MRELWGVGQRYMVVARSAPHQEAARYFACDDRGVTYYSRKQPFKLAADLRVPSGATRVGR